MKQFMANIRHWTVGLGLLAVTLGLTTVDASAAPVMDGLRDTEYKLVVSSPKDNLLVAGDINDPADPKAKVLDLADLYAANTASALYLYIELPYFDPAVVYGEWAVVMHWKGANDAIGFTQAVGDPYGASVSYAHAPAANAILKSNMRGFNAASDGDQGWAELVLANIAMDGFIWGNGNFLGNNRWENAADSIHGFGNTGAEVVYKKGDGTAGNYGAIEVMIPFDLIGSKPAESNMKAPVPGDEVLLQVYTNKREAQGVDPRYPRGPIDVVPFEAASRTDPAVGTITQFAAYTLTLPPSFDVVSGQALDLTHVNVSFSNPVGAGADVAANYTVTNLADNQPVAVGAAAVDPANNTRVILTLPTMPYGTNLRVNVSGVKNASGADLAVGKTSAVIAVGSAVVFHLMDPYGIIAEVPDPDPNTNQPRKVFMAGGMNGWQNDNGDGTGTNSIPLTAVNGDITHWKTEPMLLAPGTVYWKYLLPSRGNWDNWNILNPVDRRGYVPKSSAVVDIFKNAWNETHNGGDVEVTFTLVDVENKLAGRTVQVAGGFQGWNADVNDAYKLTPVAGKPNTYSVTVPMGTASGGTIGEDSEIYFKYIIKPDPINDPGNTLWDEFGGQDRWARIVGTGTPKTQTITDVIGGPLVQRILGAASGLHPSERYGNYFDAQDRDRSGAVSVADAIAALRQ